MNDEPTTPFDLISPDDNTAAASSETPVEEPQTQPAPIAASRAAPAGSSGGWTIPFLCIGLAILACAVLIPQSEDNRRLVYEREKLKSDLERIDRQIATNDTFLKKIAADPTLAERLAQRQMKMIRQGTSVLELKGARKVDDMSPFVLVSVPPAQALPPYEPIGGVLGNAFNHPKTQLYLIGVGLLLTAAGLVLGAGSIPQES